jgi:periplasmic copper chaperone A
LNFGHAALYHGDLEIKEVETHTMKRRLFITAVGLLPSLALAHSTKIGFIAIGHSWALPSPRGESQVMMPLFNSGAEADSLIAAKSSVADHVELRVGNLPVEEFVLEPKKPFPMRAVADHIALIGLKKPLEIGEVFPLTLVFKKAGEIKIEIFVAEKANE